MVIIIFNLCKNNNIIWMEWIFIAKYYVDTEELSEMFSNLIAASMNSDKLNEDHPSYVDVIKQLSPLDAKNLTMINIGGKLPIGDYIITLGKGKGGRVIEQDIFLETSEFPNHVQSISIRNLIWLGLIRRPEGSYLVNDEYYKKFEEHSIYKSVLDKLKEEQKFGLLGKEAKITLEKGIELTPYVIGFINRVL